MKKVKLTVEIEFSDKIVSDDDHLEVLANVKNALVEQVMLDGLAPEDSECVTESFSVHNPTINSTINHKFEI